MIIMYQIMVFIMVSSTFILLVLIREWMGMGVAGMIIDS